ncbi:hypothetical protein F2P81_023619 [Scophthalmus maximus]|uniref:Uncharacterized protein n=1 Tax=Scophthalmus maximus TaxID=52904 RepID=A0A6A4RWL3_SCOMX|nr:hypothetical protein F2P81_023619 [Scophthalmus maximus]
MELKWKSLTDITLKNEGILSDASVDPVSCGSCSSHTAGELKQFSVLSDGILLNSLHFPFQMCEKTKALGTWQPVTSRGYSYAGMQADMQALTRRANTYVARHSCKPDDLFKYPKNHRRELICVFSERVVTGAHMLSVYQLADGIGNRPPAMGVRVLQTPDLF